MNLTMDFYMPQNVSHKAIRETTIHYEETVHDGICTSVDDTSRMYTK